MTDEPDSAVARHIAAEIDVLREALSGADMPEVATLAVLWVDSDPPVVRRAYAASYERIEELADAWPDGREGLWFPEDWHGALALPAGGSRARSRSAAAARRELRAAGLQARDVLATVLQTLARNVNDDPTLLGVATHPMFFAFACHHDVDQRLFDVVRSDASATAVRWLEERSTFRFAEPYP
jgi:hypothetical protein